MEPTDLDLRIWEEELADFLPAEKLFDVHVHSFHQDYCLTKPDSRFSRRPDFHAKRPGERSTFGFNRILPVLNSVARRRASGAGLRSKRDGAVRQRFSIQRYRSLNALPVAAAAANGKSHSKYSRHGSNASASRVHQFVVPWAFSCVRPPA